MDLNHEAGTVLQSGAGPEAGSPAPGVAELLSLRKMWPCGALCLPIELAFALQINEQDLIQVALATRFPGTVVFGKTVRFSPERVNQSATLIRSVLAGCAAIDQNGREKYNQVMRERMAEKETEILKRKEREEVDAVRKFKNAARSTFALAVAHKEIARMPCEVCGNPKSEGHHENYEKPLYVVWLCRKHHQDRHAELRLSNSL